MENPFFFVLSRINFPFFRQEIVGDGAVGRTGDLRVNLGHLKQ